MFNTGDRQLSVGDGRGDRRGDRLRRSLSRVGLFSTYITYYRERALVTAVTIYCFVFFLSFSGSELAEMI